MLFGRRRGSGLVEVSERDLGKGLVRYLEAHGVEATDIAKSVRRGSDGQVITDLSMLATSIPGDTNAMGAPFATTADPNDPMFAAAAMGPGAPAMPFPLGGEPRQFVYRPGWNFPSTPDSSRGISSELLRTLADSYDLVRQCIELAKSEIMSLEWDIVPREKNRKKREQILETDTEIPRIRQMFEWPEAYMAKDGNGKWVRRGRTPWQQWISAQLEEYYVGDWLTIWPRIMNNGQVLSFERVDGATVRPLLDTEGRQPPPPYPALQVYAYGVPRASFTIEELLYRPRTMRNNTVFGFSHIEQMLLLINLALRFQMWNQSAYTDGALPIGFLEFPEGYVQDQIDAIVDQMNAVTSGLSDERQKWRGVPSGTKWNDVKPFLWDETFAQYLIEYTCSLFGFSAQKLGFMPGRGGHSLGGSGFAQQQADNADSSEKIPTARWVESLMSELLDRCLNRPDLQFEFVDLRAQNEKEGIEADQAAIFGGVKAWDTALQERGEDPVGVSEPFLMAPNGVIFVAADIRAMQEGQQRVPAPGLPMTDDEVEAANAPKPAPMIHPGGVVPPPDGGPDADPGAAPAKTPPGGGAPGGPTDAKPAPAEPVKEQPDAPKPAEPVKPKDAEKLDTSSGMQPHDLGTASANELRRWKRKVTRDLREGRKTRVFQTDVIPALTKAAIESELKKCHGAIDARIVFDRRIAKAAAKDTSVAGLVVLADDTGRVLLIQRSNKDLSDSARGTWEFPGGHLEDGETPIEGALREWKEETGITLPPGEIRAQWKNGIYEAFIYAIPHEADLPLNPDPDNRQVLNPDDPDGDDIETAAWWNPADLPEMPALREECSSTPWDQIDQATPADARKVAEQHPSGVEGLQWAKYRKATTAEDCLRCQFFAAGTCRMFNAAVFPDFTCDEWEEQRPVSHPAEDYTGKASALPTNDRQQRTHKHEKHIEEAIGAVVALKLKQARAAKAATRESLLFTDQDRKAIAAAVTEARQGAYLAGANRALDQIGQPQLEQAGTHGLTIAQQGGTQSADAFTDAWHAKLDELLAATPDSETPPVDNVIDGLERFASWRAHQEAVTQATSAYNQGKLFSFQAYPQVQMYDWSTAGDDAVCEDCQDRADNGPYEMSTLDVDELHPGCRCEVDPADGQDIAGNDITDDE